MTEAGKECRVRHNADLESSSGFPPQSFPSLTLAEVPRTALRAETDWPTKACVCVGKEERRRGGKGGEGRRGRSAFLLRTARAERARSAASPESCRSAQDVTAPSAARKATSRPRASNVMLGRARDAPRRRRQQLPRGAPAARAEGTKIARYRADCVVAHLAGESHFVLFDVKKGR